MEGSELGWAGVVVGGLLLLWWFIYSRFTALTLTDIRSIYRRGIVARRTSEVRHNDVRNLQMHQDISDRLFGVGRISISSAGQDDVEIEARGMPHPSQIVKLIRDYQS